jgi:hypothetical protein
MEPTELEVAIRELLRLLASGASQDELIKQKQVINKLAPPQ